MRRVEQESTRMGVLVEDMLLLARLDQQRPLEHRTVDLLTLAADAVHDARVVAPQRSINLTVGAGAALLVMGDEVRLRQVIGNLMSNALAHTPDTSPIDVRIRSGSPGEGRRSCAGRQRDRPRLRLRFWRSPTRAPDSRRSRQRTPSSGSTVPTRHARRGGPVSAWPSWRRWWLPTTAPSGWSPRRRRRSLPYRAAARARGHRPRPRARRHRPGAGRARWRASRGRCRDSGR